MWGNGGPRSIENAKAAAAQQITANADNSSDAPIMKKPSDQIQIQIR